MLTVSNLRMKRARFVPLCRVLPSLLLLQLFPTAAYPQTPERLVTGTVADAETGKAVPYVTVKAVNAADSLLAYAITGGDGGFTLQLDGAASALEFTLLGYERKSIGVKDARQGMLVRLEPSGIMLKELTVKASPIERRKDTINYNVAAFLGKEDRYMEDVLKKMPGIEVADDGAISYNGKPINKFNIEGQDLLGNQYNYATRNMPAEAVATVQVMENDQPVRALQGRVPSDRATLNIKLKPGYKARLFGEVKGGLGGFSDVLWNNALTLVSIGKKNQMLFTAKMNNNGESLSDDAKEHVNASDIYNYEPLPSEMVQASDFIMPPIDEKRYLRNKSYSAGLNMQRRLGRYGSLRANITFYGTSDILNDSTFAFYGGNGTLSLGERDRSKTRTSTLMPRLRYEHNAPKVYFVDELSGSISSDRYSSGKDFCQEADSPNSGGLGERAERHPGYVQNKLSMSINAGANTYSVNSLTRYFRRSETFTVADSGYGPSAGTAPGVAPQGGFSAGTYDMKERVELENFMTRNSVSTQFYAGANSFSLAYSFEVHAGTVALDGGENHRTVYMKHSFTPGYTLAYRRGNFSVSIPASIFMSRIPWSASGDKTEAYLSPAVSWRHRFSPFWKMNLSGGLGRDVFTGILTPVEYFSGYRTRVSTADRIGWTRSARASFGLNYTDVVNMFVWNLIATASWSRRDHYDEYVYGGRFTTVRPVWKDADMRMLYVMTTADKTFYGSGVSLKGSLNYNRTEMPVAQNGVTATVTGNVVSAALSLRWNKLEWMSLSVKPTFNLSWQDRSAYVHGNNVLKTFYNVAGVHLFPVKNLDVGVSWDFNLLEVGHGRYRRNSFLDASVRFVATKRLEFGMRLTNLFNRKTYEEASFTGLNYNYYSLPLRGREVLLSAYVDI